MVNGIRLACVIVLYNPTDAIVDKVIGYGHLFGRVIAIDNSATVNLKLHGRACVDYVALKGNKGLAYALDYGIHRAYSCGYQWVMLLDQDSIVNEECIDRLCSTISCVNNDDKIAMVGANFRPDLWSPDKGTETVNFLITSGTVLRTSAYHDLGPVMTSLFIDAIDYEYCYRALSKGYRIIRDNEALFTHQVGNPTFVGEIECSNYEPFRYYFITRNNLIVSQMYIDKFPDCQTLRDSIIRYKNSVQYESNKRMKYLYMKIGKFDYKLWRLTGKIFCHIPLPK